VKKEGVGGMENSHEFKGGGRKKEKRRKWQQDPKLQRERESLAPSEEGKKYVRKGLCERRGLWTEEPNKGRRMASQCQI